MRRSKAKVGALKIEIRRDIRANEVCLHQSIK